MPGSSSSVTLPPFPENRFVAAVGKGVMKMLIFDRGFLDGKTITHLKKDNGIDCLFPLKKGIVESEDEFIPFRRIIFFRVSTIILISKKNESLST